ncbi:hypothetical protein FOCC_FOCC017074, partial [Frankliniella occidentalis]
MTISSSLPRNQNNRWYRTEFRQPGRVPQTRRRQPQARSRQPRPGSQQPRPGSRQPRLGSRQPRPASRQPRPESRRPRPGNRQPPPGGRQRRGGQRLQPEVLKKEVVYSVTPANPPRMCRVIKCRLLLSPSAAVRQRLVRTSPPARRTMTAASGRPIAGAERGAPSGGVTPLPSGRKYTLVLHRRTEDKLDVWLDGRPVDKVSVDLGPGMSFLKASSPAGMVTFVQGQEVDGYHMEVGERVIVRLNVTRDGLLDLGLCGDRACSVVRVTGADDKGAFGYSTRITSSNSVTEERGQALQQTEGSEVKGFTAGRSLRLMVQHAPPAGGRPAQLRVWMEGDGDGDGDDQRMAVVDLDADQGRRPRLKLASSVGPTTLVQVLTEGRELAVGEMATLVLTVSKEDGWLWLGLCSADACSAMGVIGAGEDNRFSFTSRITTSNSVVGDGPVWQSSTRGPRKFISGQRLRFVVHRRTAGLMDVWLEPASSRKTTIPLEEDRVVLKVASDAGSVAYEDGGAGGYQLSVSEQVRVEVRPVRPQGWVFVGLCGSATCTVLGVGGATGGRLNTATRVSAAGSVLAP